METPNPSLVLGAAVDRVVRRLIAVFLLAGFVPLLLKVDDPYQGGAVAATSLLALLPIGLALLWRLGAGDEHPNVPVLAVILGVSEIVTELVLVAGRSAPSSPARYCRMR